MAKVLKSWTAASSLLLLLAATGCSAGRIAMDYEIRIDRLHGEAQHVPETATYASGERFRLRITTHGDVYLYVLNKGTSGRWNVLFPDPRINNGSNYVKGWSHVIIPPPGGGAYQFDAASGVETVVMCASRKAVPALDSVARGQEKDPARIEALLQRLEGGATERGAFDKIQHGGHTQVVLDTPNTDAVMVNRMSLAHRPIGQ